MVSVSWQQLVDDPANERHIVQLYRGPAFLVDAVTRWVSPGLRSGGGAVLVSTPEHAALIRARLRDTGMQPDAMERAGRLRVIDADTLFSDSCVNGTLDRDPFRRNLGAVIRDLRKACGRDRCEVRAWGELVNLLWHRGERDTAQRLESIWNEIIEEHHLHLLCSYRVDNLDPETHSGALKHVCAGHTQLIPEEDYGRFEVAVARALVDVFGAEESRTVGALFAARRSVPIGMPPAEAILVALHDIQPELGRRVLRAARLHLASLGGVN